MIQGIIGKKLGMTHVFRDNGRMEAVTAIEAGPCPVTQVKTMGKERGHLGELGQLRYIRELRVADTKEIVVGNKIDVSVFKAGDRVDVTGVSKGKGFAGVVKRHHFHGGPKTHGQSDRLRAPGAISSTTTPGHVFKGLRMAGHMGADKVTTRHLEVIEADPARNLLLVRGAVPGGRNGLVLIQKSRGGK
jgi:large subunit ribosomal protein L3